MMENIHNYLLDWSLKELGPKNGWNYPWYTKELVPIVCSVFETLVLSYSYHYDPSHDLLVCINMTTIGPSKSIAFPLNQKKWFGWHSTCHRHHLFSTKCHLYKWWFNQPSWKICSSNWIISPILWAKIKIYIYLKPPPNKLSWYIFHPSIPPILISLFVTLDLSLATSKSTVRTPTPPTPLPDHHNSLLSSHLRWLELKTGVPYVLGWREKK